MKPTQCECLTESYKIMGLLGSIFVVISIALLLIGLGFLADYLWNHVEIKWRR